MFEITPHTLHVLNQIVAKLPDDVPTFRCIPITEFEKDDVIKICRIFASEMKSYADRKIK